MISFTKLMPCSLEICDIYFCLYGNHLCIASLLYIIILFSLTSILHACLSSDIFCYLGHIPIGKKQISKNLYYETFLSNFDKALKKELRHFVIFKIFTILIKKRSNWL